MYKEGNFDVSIVNHDRGHSVPIRRDKDSMRAFWSTHYKTSISTPSLEDYIVDWIIDIAKQKVQLIR